MAYTTLVIRLPMKQFLSSSLTLLGKLVSVHFITPLSTRGDRSIGCYNNQSRTSSAQWPAPPARGMRIVSTQGTIEVCESSHYRLDYT